MLAFAVLLGAATTGDVHANDWGLDTSLPMATPSVLPTPKSLGGRLDQIHLSSPARPRAEVLSIFKMRLSDLLPSHLGWSRTFLQPYVLGGKADQAVPVGRRIGNSIPGEASATALHFGAGTDLRLDGGVTLSFDFSELQQTGDTGEETNRAYTLAVRYDF